MMGTQIQSSSLNRFPSLTWHHLHINHADFSGTVDAACHLCMESLPQGIRHEGLAATESPDGFDGIRTQWGEPFEASFSAARDALSVPVQVLSVPDGIHVPDAVRATLRVSGADRALSDSAITAGADSVATFIIDFRSDAGAAGLLCSRIRVRAGERALVRLVTVNLLGDSVSHLCGIGAELAQGARLELTHVELGARESYAGSAVNLAGHKASCSCRAAAVTRGKHRLDLNYVAYHRAPETESTARFDSVLLDGAKKTWRGTIQFSKGCAGAMGEEQESVLLLSPAVTNKSMPVILCDEEQVEGHHGASIGRLDKRTLLYLESRGMDEEAARALLIRSRITAVSATIPDAVLVEDIRQFLEEAF